MAGHDVYATKDAYYGRDFPRCRDVCFYFPADPYYYFGVYGGGFLRRQLGHANEFRSGLPHSAVIYPVFPEARGSVVQVYSRLSVVIVVDHAVPHRVYFLRFEFGCDVEVVYDFGALRFLRVAFRNDDRENIPVRFKGGKGAFHHRKKFGNDGGYQVGQGVRAVSRGNVCLYDKRISRVLVFRYDHLRAYRLFSGVLYNP